MISILDVLIIWFIHWVADFHMQTHEMATQKSKSNYWLSMHVLVYTGVTLLFWHFTLLRPATEYTLWEYAMFSGYIFIGHWVTDYITSRMTSKLYAEGKFHDFFVVIGFDQFIHLVHLLIGYHIFIK